MPMTVRTGGGASPALGWALPSSGEAFAEPLEPPGVPSALNPAEQMALSHPETPGSGGTGPALSHGQARKTVGAFGVCAAAAQGTCIPGGHTPAWSWHCPS